MSKYPHTLVFGFPSSQLVMENYINQDKLNESPNIITIESLSLSKVFKQIMEEDRLNNTALYKFIILRKTSSGKILPNLLKNDSLYELNTETMQYIPFIRKP